MKVKDILGKKLLLDGNEMAAIGALLSRAEVIAAYPITPSTPIVEKLSEFCKNGELAAEFIEIESEHSALAALVGASTMGTRTFTATSSQGLALMHEVLHWASGARVPIVIVNVNRTLGAPWNILPDQTDSLSQRDTGWIHFYCGNCQEVLDTIIQAFKIAEKVMLPVMVSMEGFYLSHFSEPVNIPTQEEVDRFLPPFSPQFIPGPDHPFSWAGQHQTSQFKKNIQLSMELTKKVSLEAFEEFERIFGRKYDSIKSYFPDDDNDIIVIASGTITGTALDVITKLRKRNIKIGLLKIRMLRPFPLRELRFLTRKARKIIVLDRNLSPGMGGIFCQEVKSGLYNAKQKPIVLGYIVGLAGDDVNDRDILGIIENALKRDRAQEIIWTPLENH